MKYKILNYFSRILVLEAQKLIIVEFPIVTNMEKLESQEDDGVDELAPENVEYESWDRVV